MKDMVDREKQYGYWNAVFESKDLTPFNGNRLGLLWLKVKSISRNANNLQKNFCSQYGYVLTSNKLTEKFKELFEILSEDCESSLMKLDDYLRIKEKEVESTLDSNCLINQLYKIGYFKWSSGNNNDLGKSLVKKYVKDNPSFDFLMSELDVNIAAQVKDYLVCSWYNNWTSILIENIFKTNRSVVPATGRVESVDFFIKDIPFDLKVTHLPQNYVDSKRKKRGLKDEHKAIENICKHNSLRYFPENDIETLIRLVKDNHSASANFEEGIVSFRRELINEIKEDSSELERNLYEEQSDFRFGAENRLFLVLVDKDHYEDSWKMKRDVSFLKPVIEQYLNDFDPIHFENKAFSFTKDGHDYSPICDTLIIEK